MPSTSSVPESALHDLLARFPACGDTGNAGMAFLCGSPADGAALVMMGCHLDSQVRTGCDPVGAARRDLGGPA